MCYHTPRFKINLLDFKDVHQYIVMCLRLSNESCILMDEMLCEVPNHAK